MCEESKGQRSVFKQCIPSVKRHCHEILDDIFYSLQIETLLGPCTVHIIVKTRFVYDCVESGSMLCVAVYAVFFRHQFEFAHLFKL